jgi:hypothetical protein
VTNSTNMFLKLLTRWYGASDSMIVLVVFFVGAGWCVTAVVHEVVHMCSFDHCRMWCNLDVRITGVEETCCRKSLYAGFCFSCCWVFLLMVSSGFRSCAEGLLYVYGVYLVLLGMNFGVCLWCFVGWIILGMAGCWDAHSVVECARLTNEVAETIVVKIK